MVGLAVSTVNRVSGNDFSSIMQMYMSFLDVFFFGRGVISSMQHPPLKRKRLPPGLI